MDTRETPAAKAAEAAAPKRTWRHMYFSNTKNFLYPRRNDFSTDRPCAAYCYPKKRSHMWSIWLLPKWFSNVSNKPSNKKTGQRLTLMWDSVWIWGGRWPRWSVLPPGIGMRIAAWCWRKSCWLSIHNKVKSEQCFTVTSAKRVAAFHTSLKQVPNSPTRITNALHPKDQDIYEKEDAVNKNDTLNFEMTGWLEALWRWWGSKKKTQK